MTISLPVEIVSFGRSTNHILQDCQETRGGVSKDQQMVSNLALDVGLSYSCSVLERFATKEGRCVAWYMVWTRRGSMWICYPRMGSPKIQLLRMHFQVKFLPGTVFVCVTLVRIPTKTTTPSESCDDLISKKKRN